MNSGKNFLLEIINVLNVNKVNYIIVGGVAVVLQGVERLTMGLDAAVALDQENIKRFLNAMRELELEPRLPIPAESLLEPAKVQMMRDEKNALVFTFIDPKLPIRQVDFFLSKDLSYDSLKNDYEEMDLEGQKIKVLTKSKLVELELRVNPIRDKDMSDIKEL